MDKMIAIGTPITSVFSDGTIVQGVVTYCNNAALQWRAREDHCQYLEALSQEGIAWVRGWEGPEVDAFKAACAL